MNDNNRNGGDSTGRCSKTGQFKAGNPGRQPGTRNKATKAVQQLLDAEAESISRVCIRQALTGDMQAIRLVLERVVPPMRESPVDADLPALDADGGVPAAIAGVWRAVGDGTLTPGQAERLTRLVAGYTRAKEVEELECRIRALEAATPLQSRVQGMSDDELLEQARAIIERKEGQDEPAESG